MCQAFGNALFFGSLGAGAFFGYYTLRYTADQVDTMVEQTKAPENSFPGSSVRHPAFRVRVQYVGCTSDQSRHWKSRPERL